MKGPSSRSIPVTPPPPAKKATVRPPPPKPDPSLALPKGVANFPTFLPGMHAGRASKKTPKILDQDPHSNLPESYVGYVGFSSFQSWYSCGLAFTRGLFKSVWVPWVCTYTPFFNLLRQGAGQGQGQGSKSRWTWWTYQSSEEYQPWCCPGQGIFRLMIWVGLCGVNSWAREPVKQLLGWVFPDKYLEIPKKSSFLKS